MASTAVLIGLGIDAEENVRLPDDVRRLIAAPGEWLNGDRPVDPALLAFSA